MAAITSLRVKSKSARRLLPKHVSIGCAFLASADDAAGVVREALTRGVTDFDVAPLYGQGRMERFLGEGIAQLSAADAARARVFTKVGRVLVGEGDTIAVDNDYTYAGAERSLRGSVDRLGPAARIHGLKIHDPNDSLESGNVDEVAISLGENDNERGIADALVHMRDVEGTIASVGIGMNTNVEKTDTEAGVVALPPSLSDGVPAEVVRMLRGKPVGTYDGLAGGWMDLLSQDGLASLLACQERGIRATTAGVFSTGLLVGKMQYAYQEAPRAGGARRTVGCPRAGARDDLTPSRTRIRVFARVRGESRDRLRDGRGGRKERRRCTPEQRGAGGIVGHRERPRAAPGGLVLDFIIKKIYRFRLRFRLRF